MPQCVTTFACLVELRVPRIPSASRHATMDTDMGSTPARGPLTLDEPRQRRATILDLARGHGATNALRFYT
jgi:hypothetical protein